MRPKVGKISGAKAGYKLCLVEEVVEQGLKVKVMQVVLGNRHEGEKRGKTAIGAEAVFVTNTGRWSADEHDGDDESKCWNERENEVVGDKTGFRAVTVALRTSSDL